MAVLQGRQIQPGHLNTKPGCSPKPGNGRSIRLAAPAASVQSRYNLLMDNYRAGVVVLLVAGLLDGCAALVVGGVAAGSYYVATDERSIVEITEDAGITASINSKFFTDDLVSPAAVNVDTHKGVVTLLGTVKSSEVARRAYDLAYSVEGVSLVVSKLSIRSQPMTPWGPVNQ